jgi:hypothetical protein
MRGAFTPHPALRATFSHKGRRIERFSFSPCGRRWIDAERVETDEGCP